eukprot:Hpha_TRINITY_DN10758_c0_g1::TRINITY_DN10758_c0_g1_i1::g.43706::m.43706
MLDGRSSPANHEIRRHSADAAAGVYGAEVPVSFGRGRGQAAEGGLSRSGTEPSLRRKSGGGCSDLSGSDVAEGSGRVLDTPEVGKNPHPTPESDAVRGTPKTAPTPSARRLSPPLGNLGKPAIPPPVDITRTAPLKTCKGRAPDLSPQRTLALYPTGDILPKAERAQMQQKLRAALARLGPTDQEAAQQLSALIESLGAGAALSDGSTESTHVEASQGSPSTMYREDRQEKILSAFGDGEGQRSGDALAELNKQHLNEARALLHMQRQQLGGDTPVNVASPTGHCPALLSPHVSNANDSTMSLPLPPPAPLVEPMPLPPRAAGRGAGIEPMVEPPPQMCGMQQATPLSGLLPNGGFGLPPQLPLAQPLPIKPGYGGSGDSLSVLQMRHQHEQQVLLMQQQQELRQLEHQQFFPLGGAMDPLSNLHFQRNLALTSLPAQGGGGHLMSMAMQEAQMQMPQVPMQLPPGIHEAQPNERGSERRHPARSHNQRTAKKQPQQPIQGAKIVPPPTPPPAEKGKNEQNKGEKSGGKKAAKGGASGTPQQHQLNTDVRKLINITESVLLDPSANKFLGSLPAVVVQRLVYDRDPERYNQVIDTHYEKSFHAFVKAHDQFRMFFYDREVIESRGLTHCSPDEGRITFSELPNTALVHKDWQTAQWKGELWEQALQVIETMIREQPLQMRSLIQRFRDNDKEKVFEGVLPSNHAFRQLLRRHQDRLIITHDALVKVPELLDDEERAEWERKLAIMRENKLKKPQPAPTTTAEVDEATSDQPHPQPRQPVEADGPRRTKARGRRERRARARAEQH